MENASVIEIMAWEILPEYFDRFSNWISEVYYPLGIKCGRKAIERYHIVKVDPKYNITVSMMYYQDFDALTNFLNDPEIIYSNNDLNITYGPRREVLWGAGYEKLKGFRNSEPRPSTDLTTLNESSPVMHLEGYNLDPEDFGKYHSWFAKWGYQFYIPLIMKMPGLTEYSHYRIIDYDQPEVMRPQNFSVHPKYLSVLQFENLKAFQNYEKSTELAAFREAMKIPFPNGLPFQWYVQYQLIRSWRK